MHLTQFLSPTFTLSAMLGVGLSVSVGCDQSEATSPQITPLQQISGDAERLQAGQTVEVVAAAAREQDQAAAAEAMPLPERIDYNRHIRPVIAANCFACHGPDAHDAKADVQLHTADHAVDGFLIVEGDPEASEVWLRINNTKKPMPPVDSHKELSDHEKALIKRWIEQGAEYMPHWAYVPPKHTPTPEIADSDWATSWIDHYTLKTMREHGLEPTEDADRVTLVRRLYYDLTGLPPTPAEVQAVVEDTSPDAIEKLVDRLLASPQFGERLAVYWLDIVRYGDTVGYHGDQTQSISPYRDWVIWAFNENMPYNKFITHQIAGDMVEDVDDNSLIASAYNRLYQTSHEGGIQRKEYEAIYDADRIRNFSEAFMGASIGCAECHDHKYDPFTDEDFYSLAAFFGQMDDLWHLPKDDGQFSKAGNTNPTQRHPEIEVLSPLDVARKQHLQHQLEGATDPQAREKIQKQVDAIKPRKVMISKQLPEQEYRQVRYLTGGNWLDDSGPVMTPAVPAFMGEIETDDGSVPTRLDLAQWLITSNADGGSGGLTARVFVNRMWYLMYGEGLSTSLRDFGGQGKAPNHPELLDRLTLEFMESGWDIKWLFKELALTRTYQLSTTTHTNAWKKDPINQYFARQTGHRLQAEMIRDTALAVSGLLNDQLGGETAHPYQPVGYYRHLNFPNRKYKHDENISQWRRGVYVHRQRQFMHPMLKAFDAPERVDCTARRPISNTPLAALNLLNDPTFVEASRVFAARVLTEAQGDDLAKLDWAMHQLLSRSPDDREVQIILSVLDENRGVYAADKAAAEKLLNIGLAERDKSLDPVEHAAWTQACRLMLNLHETITRP